MALVCEMAVAHGTRAQATELEAQVGRRSSWVPRPSPRCGAWRSPALAGRGETVRKLHDRLIAVPDLLTSRPARRQPTYRGSPDASAVSAV